MSIKKDMFFTGIEPSHLVQKLLADTFLVLRNILPRSPKIYAPLHFLKHISLNIHLHLLSKNYMSESNRLTHGFAVYIPICHFHWIRTKFVTVLNCWAAIAHMQLHNSKCCLAPYLLRSYAPRVIWAARS